MARGLSDLQRWMLVRALENSESDICKMKTVKGVPGYTADFSYIPEHLTRSEIRAGYYEFTPVSKVYVREETQFFDGRKWYDGSRLTSEWQIGDSKDREWLRRAGQFVKSNYPNYAAVNLAITRAHRRLRERGLATDQAGFYLTDKGREQARVLAALGNTALPEMPIDLSAAPKIGRSQEQPIEK